VGTPGSHGHAHRDVEPVTHAHRDVEPDADGHRDSRRRASQPDADSHLYDSSAQPDADIDAEYDRDPD
jgi:hypothetical protein